MIIKSLFFLYALFAGVDCKGSERPQVTTPLGKVVGYPRQSHHNRPYAAFEGIPYAKPPIGPLRFAEAEPVEPWKGIWDASSPTECAQTEMFFQNAIIGDEDCLHINVYVPRENPDPSEKLDVVVHIHGGAFMVASGHIYANPDYLMDRDVVFVTFNYRLNLFGFLSTEDDVIPGNNGLKDQILALKWVQQNIASFGGNPDSVTLTGLSAGGISVHYHYLSPLSKGLFHRGIANSGMATMSVALQEEPLKKAKLLAHSVGCPQTPTKALADCLRSRPYRQLLSKVQHFFAFRFLPTAPFAPVIEKNAKRPFIEKNPFYLLTQGPVNDVPLIVSTTSDEGMFPVAFLANSLDEIDDKWNEAAPFLLDFNFTLSKTLWKEISTEIKDYYIGKDKKISMETIQDFVRMCSDRYFLVDTVKAAKLQAKTAKSPVYYYNFAYVHENNPNKTVGHGEDSMFVFKGMYAKTLTENDLKVKDIMLDMITSFAKTNLPEIDGINWTPTGYQELTYLNITGPELEGLKVETKKELAPTAFWDSLGFMENQNLVIMKDEL